MKGLFQCPPRASPWVLKQIQKSRPERAKAFNIKAFALSGRLCFLSTLPRAMPWARSFWAFSPTLLPLSGLMTHPRLKLLAFKVSWIPYKSYQQFPWILPLWAWDAPCGSLHQPRCSLGWGGYGHEEPPDPILPELPSCMGRLPW